MAEKTRSSMSSMASQICNQISSVFSKTTSRPSALQVMVDEISTTSSRGGKVFVYGVGREGLMMKALCMRLFHLGLSTHCISDMTTPPISSSDLLIASAGPGGFSTVDAMCGVAKRSGGRVLLVTAQPETGSSAKFADSIAYLPAQTMAEEEKEFGLLPMGSLYEGVMYVLFEMVVFKLSEVLEQSPEAIRARHTNLE